MSGAVERDVCVCDDDDDDDDDPRVADGQSMYTWPER
jgi:hypothetical protein